MKKINIDNFNSYKEILSLILNLYKINKENKFILYTIKQDRSLIYEVIENIFPKIYKFKEIIYLRVFWFPVCFIKNEKYRELFWDLNIEWFIWHINVKNSKECLKCIKYNNCLWYEKNNNIIWIKNNRDILIKWEEIFKKLEYIYNYFINIWIKVWFKSTIYDLEYIIINNLDCNFKNVECIIIEWYEKFKITNTEVTNEKWFEHNLFLKKNNKWILKDIYKETKLSIEFSIIINNTLFINNVFNIDNIFLYRIIQNKKEKILELLENIFITKWLDLLNKEFNWIWIWNYRGKLIFINCEDIYHIKNDFDKYIVFVNDSIKDYVPYIYQFKYFIAHIYNPVTHFALISREINWELFHWLPYDFLLNLKTWDNLNINYETWKIMKM